MLIRQLFDLRQHVSNTVWFRCYVILTKSIRIIFEKSLGAERTYHTSVHGSFDLIRTRICSYGDGGDMATDRAFLLQVSDSSHRCQPVHFRHLQVHQDNR